MIPLLATDVRCCICRLSFCGVPRERSIYGLYDNRNHDIFYVGSAFDARKRFNTHLREHPYVQAMLARGQFPICLVLLEFRTQCDRYSRTVEIAVAQWLRKQGHSAYSDDTIHTGEAFYTMVEEQAHQRDVLSGIWHAG